MHQEGADVGVSRFNDPVPSPPGASPRGRLWPVRGAWAASDDGGWLPGIYADEAAARRALEIAQTDYLALEAAVASSVRGRGDAYRPVTADELDELT